jgi:putative phosphoesterase
MIKIGVVSDTHGILTEEVIAFLKGSDQLWHAGDVGDFEVIKKLENIAPEVHAVFGNIDGQDIRLRLPEVETFMAEDLNVLLLHIGGTPSRYNPKAIKLIKKYKPDIFVCGHSHILKIKYDTKNNLLYINPGAAGRNGFHKSITAVRFEIHGKELKNMEILDIPRSNK